MNCSQAGLLNIPDNIPDSATDIDVSNNRIRDLHSDDFENCIEVRSLSFQRNDLQMIPQAIFNSMINIRVLRLQDNYLHYNRDSFPTNLFGNLTKLYAISLQSVKISGLKIEEFSRMVSILPSSLEELNINIPGVRGIADKIKKFVNLRKLGLYDGPSDKPFELRKDTFKALKNIAIQELKIKTPHLANVHSSALSHFRTLKTLDMSETKGLSIADLQPALLRLNTTNLKKLKLSHFARSESGSDLVVLNERFFENRCFRNLVDIEMDNTEIYIIKFHRGSLYKLEYLRKLDLSSNFLSLKLINSYPKLWKRLTNLRELDLSSQTSIRHDATTEVTLDLPSNLSKLDLSHIRSANHGLPMKIIIPSPSVICNFKFHSNFVGTLERFEVSHPDPTVLFEADLSRNNMESFNGAFDQSIQNGLNVHSLLLHENKLGHELGERGLHVFRNFTNLTILDLASNEIKMLPHFTFQNQHAMEYLNLSKNALLVTRLHISQMHNIKLLDLSDNLISQFDQQFQDDIDSLKLLSTNFTINLMRNPIQCSCETHHFLRWMYQRRFMFIQFDEYTCLHQRELIIFANINRLLETLDYQCSENLIVKVSAGLLAFIIFVVAISVFLYRHKWDVKFFCLRFITDRKAYLELRETDTEYEYDAFVSYHKDDRAWVRDELYKNIEMRDSEVDAIDRPRFRLCIHDRDFIPGEAIEENILKAIESSRKTIVILSKNFLKSAWCEFELQIARKECVEKGRNLIIAVMLEPLSVDDKMSRSVERLIRKNTYIEWPDDPSNREHFWKKLRSVLES